MSRMSASVCLFLSFACLAALAPSAHAQVVPGQLNCEVRGNTVFISWEDVVFGNAGVRGRLTRDGEVIAEIEPGDVSFTDRDVPRGVHVYELTFATSDGVARTLACRVQVGDVGGGIRCAVDGNVVSIQWDVPATVPAQGFLVLRDGDVVARLGRDARSYREEVEPGAYTYAVTTNNSILPQEGPADVLIGECRVVVEGEGFGLDCRVDGNRVSLRWEFPIDIRIAGFAVLRNGERVAFVDANEFSYSETAPPGDHVYTVLAVRIVADPDRPSPDIFVGRCEVSVPFEPGIRCSVDGDIVTIRWEIPDDILALGFIVTRNDEIVARLGPDARSYREQAPPGEHVYTVSTNNTVGGQRPPDFLIGECTVVVVGGFGLSCRVNVTEVHLQWQFPIDLAITGFLILRDGARIGFVEPNEFRFQDEPGPGEHTYSVFAVPETFDPDVIGELIFVGSCMVDIAGLPGPEGLECAIAESFPIQVQLFWRNPVRYEAIVVTRNNERIALLEGDAERFSETDPGPGRYIYGVFGVRDGVRSEAATCVIVIQEPPARNRLFFRNVALTPDDTAAGSDTVLVSLDNDDPVQGWSFGVCSDPSVTIVEDATIEGTDTARLNDGEGPSFLALNRVERGLTMAVVIDDMDPGDVLPPAPDDRPYGLLRIDYEPGPDAERNTPYRVAFCDDLGRPPVAVVLVVDGFEVDPETRPGTIVFRGFRYLRADVNNDLGVDMSDGVYIVVWLFLNGPEPGCTESADTNGSGQINIADGIYVFSNLFGGGPPPPAPYPNCGNAPRNFDCEETACSD